MSAVLLNNTADIQQSSCDQLLRQNKTLHTVKLPDVFYQMMLMEISIIIFKGT